MLALLSRQPSAALMGVVDVMTAAEAGEFIKNRRRELGLTQERVAEELGINSPNYLSMLEKGRVNIRRSAYLRPLARLLRLTADEVRQIDPDAVVEVDAQPREELLSVDDYQIEPVRGEVYAGWGYEFDDRSNFIDEEFVPRRLWKRDMKVVQVKGDSMTPTFQIGDRLYVDSHDIELQRDKIYLVHVNGNGVLVKRARFYVDEDAWYLVSDNSKFRPLKPDEATVLGRVYFKQPQGSEI